MEHLRHFMISSTGSVLRAWIEFFDQDMDHRISKAEFSKGLRELGYKGDVFSLFSVLDDDDSNELTLDEVDVKQATIWRNFRLFVGSRFRSEEELFMRCSDAADLEKGRRLREAKDQLSREDFCIGLRKCGWTWGVGDLNWVFDALQDQQQGILKVENLRWMGIELARKQKKQEAKARSKKWQALKRSQGISPQVKHRHFATFKAFLRKKFGNLIRAWRQALSQTDSMVLSKLHFLKAASRLGFAKESKELWKALDKDDSGSASIDELDPKNAELLAHFKVWVSQKFGGVRDAFNAIDSDSTRFITATEFANGLKKFEFERPTKQLFSHFDKDGDGKIIIDDVMFLENWTPLPFLVVAPNYKAKEEIRRLILVRTGQYMKAWRRLLDKDATNRCNWYEFKEACQVLGYTGDIPGAWRAFDDDLSGYISLKEIDESSAMILSNFRKWAIMEFGSMRSLFSVFDEDCSGSLSWQEFRYACNAYSYDGSIRSLFNALDVDQTGSLTLKEVVFLEDWDDPDEDERDRLPLEGPNIHAQGAQVGYSTLVGAPWQVTDRPARRFEVVRRKRELEERAMPSARLRVSRQGEHEKTSWSLYSPKTSRGEVREVRLHSRQRRSVRSQLCETSENYEEPWKLSQALDGQDWMAGSLWSSRDSGWEEAMDTPSMLIDKVGLQLEKARSGSPWSCEPETARPATVPTKRMKTVGRSPRSPRAPSLDQLFSPRTRSPEALELRAAEARSLERGVRRGPSRSGHSSAFQKCLAYYL